MSEPTPSRPVRLTALQRRLLLELTSARAHIEDAAARCPPGEQDAAALLASTRAELDAWEATLRAPQRPLDLQRDRMLLQQLARRRLYLLTPSELVSESRAALRHLREQGVPARVRRDMEELHSTEILPAVTGAGALGPARAAATRLLEAHDVWVTHAEIHGRNNQIAGVLLSLCSATAVCLAMLCLHHHLLVPGFLLGGGAGATVSIASRPPPCDTLGSLRTVKARMWARLTLGLAACIVGLGMMASGLLTLPLGGVPLGDTIASCGGSPSPHPCTKPSMLALLGVAVLLGFSERALASFESSLLGQVQGGETAKAARPAEAGPPSSEQNSSPSSRRAT